MSVKPYRLVIFDWDGTLMDSAGRIVSSMQAVARRLLLTVPSDDDVKEIIGISLKPAITQLFGQLDAQQEAQLVAAYRDEYVDNNTTPTPLFNGAIEVLDECRQQGLKLAVATGKARRGLDRVWQETDTRRFFHGSRCADEAQSKPHPEMLFQLLDEFQVGVDEAVMIGDTVHDMKMAQAAGMDRIGVSFGAHHGQRLKAYEPIAVIDELGHLGRYLQR